MPDDQTLSTTPLETAVYIEKMCAELAQLATHSEMPFLTYLLNMAREDASMEVVKRKSEPKAEELEMSEDS